MQPNFLIWKEVGKHRKGVYKGVLKSTKCPGQMQFPMHLQSVGSISPPWRACVGLYYVILHYVRLDQIRLDKILIISMTLMISTGTMNQTEGNKCRRRVNQRVCVHARACPCAFVLWFDSDLPNESKTWCMSTKRGSTFSRHVDGSWQANRQTISSSSGFLQPWTCLCAHQCTSSQSVSTRIHEPWKCEMFLKRQERSIQKNTY